jgi:transposase
MLHQKETERLRAYLTHQAVQTMGSTALVDNARYNHAVLHADWRSDYAVRFSLLYLHAYSPELNPIERIWKLTRRLATHNSYFAHVEEVVHAVESLFENWKMSNTALSKLYGII